MTLPATTIVRFIRKEVLLAHPVETFTQTPLATATRRELGRGCVWADDGEDWGTRLKS